jgi:hypothetical protein
MLLVQLGINSTRDVWKFWQKFQTSLVLLIPNCTRHCMITYTNQKTNGRLYTCFVDLKKAFDSAWHDGLYLKLLKNKISGNFYKLM